MAQKVVEHALVPTAVVGGLETHVRMILVKFWLKRFAMTLGAIALLQVAVGAIQSEATDYGNVMFWSAIGGVATASINTYWARSRGCRLTRAKPGSRD